MNSKLIRYSPTGTAIALALILGSGNALATSSIGKKTDAYCKTYNGSTPINGNCNACHTSNRSTRKDPQWSWYLTAPAGASDQMKNFCGAAPNQAPDSSITAPANNSTVAVGTAVSFAGSGSDPDNNTPLSYSWNFGGGAANSTAQNPTVSFTKAGTYTVTLTASDAKGLADASPATITLKVVDAPNQAPDSSITAPSNNSTVTVGTAVSFAGSGSDPDNNTPLSYSWNFGGGAANSTAQNPTVSFTKAGTYTVTLTASDAKGLADASPATITLKVVDAPNQAPDSSITAPANNSTVTVGTAVSFAGTGSDPDNNTPLSYSWNFGGGAANSTAQNPTVSFAKAGTYTVTLTVSDAKGLADASPATITVKVIDAANQAPKGTITEPSGNVEIAPGAQVKFAGAGTDPDNNTPLSYSWNFGGGAANSTAQNPTVSFAKPGSYTVTFTVTDAKGLADPMPPVRTVVVRGGSSLPTGCSDADGDGYSPDGGVCGPVDCSDNNPAINPGAGEVCGDGIDNDCDGKADSSDSECNGKDCVSGMVKPQLPVVIARSKWYPETQKLEVYGKQAPVGTGVNLLNAKTGALIDAGVTRGDGWWKFNLYNLAVVPCRIRVEIAGQSAEHHVNSAPATCDSATIPDNKAPESSIVAPADGTTVVLGQVVDFLGSGSDPDGNTPLSYSWDFGGGATSSQQNPRVVFKTAGSVTVKLTVKDAKGLADPTPATVTFKVVEPANQAPDSTITAPANNSTVTVGSTVSFAGSGFDPDNNTPLLYHWNFGGGAADSKEQNPKVSFARAGTYKVTLTVRDAKGLADPSPASITIKVAEAQGNCNPVAATLPLVINGAGEFCRVVTGDLSEFNSWNTQLVEINGVAITNAYWNSWSRNKLPAKINGAYIIHYVGKYPWSHFEVKGGGDRHWSNNREREDGRDDRHSSNDREREDD